MSDDPRTKAVVLEGLQQALRERIAKLWGNVSLAGEPNAGGRFEKGLCDAVADYEAAWKYIEENIDP